MRSIKKILLIGFLLAIMIIAAGCNPSQSTEEPAAALPAETEPATQPATEAPTATQPDEMVEEPEETEEPEEPGETEDSSGGDAMLSGETSACETCHADQAMLIDTADPVEEIESENEGAG